MSKVYKNNKTGYSGICFESKPSKYRAYISVHGERVRLGYFAELQDAINAREQAENFYKFKIGDNDKRFKTILFVIKEDIEKYEEAFYYLIEAALSYDGTTCFSTYAVNKIKEGLIAGGRFKKVLKEFEEMNFDNKEMYISWLNGVSIRQLAKDYNVNAYTVKKNIKNCNDFIERRL